MQLSRRDLMLGSFASFVLSAVPFVRAEDVEQPETLFAATRREVDGTYAAAIFRASGEDVAVAPLPARGHDIAVHPVTRDCVAFARRPGRFAVVFSARTRQAPRSFTARPDRHFYGHGTFSPDGRLLYTTENDFDNARGVIGVRDVAAGYRQIGEFSSGGVGPHDLALLPDGQTLVVANGGIETHPDMGRLALNLPTMKPSLAYIDTRTGDILERCELPARLHQLSIRHLAAAEGGKVVFGCQYQGPAEDMPALVGFHKRGQEVQLVEAPDMITPQLKNYIGSVSTDRSGSIAAASAPRGGYVTFWDVATQAYLGEKRLPDGCGVASAPQPHEFLLTSGTGRLVLLDPAQGELARASARSNWDNHAVAL